MTLDSLEKLTEVNLPDLEEIGKAFTSEVGYVGGFCIEEFLRVWGATVAAGVSEVFAIYHGDRIAGALGCSFIPDAFNGRMTACESFWYVLPEYRGAKLANQLFDAFEAEAKKRECKKIIIGHLDTPQTEMLQGLYLKRGYRPIEKTFGKEV